MLQRTKMNKSYLEDSKSVQWNGITFLKKAAGSQGYVFVDAGRRGAVKLFKSPEDCNKEYEILLCFTMLVPEYSPGPVAKIRPDLGSTMEIYGFYMSYAGEVLENLATDLTLEETILLVEQYVYTVLCISDKLCMRDIHMGNVCVLHRNCGIRLKIIDTEVWSMKTDQPKVSANVHFLWQNQDAMVTFVRFFRVFRSDDVIQEILVKYRNSVRDYDWYEVTPDNPQADPHIAEVTRIRSDLALWRCKLIDILEVFAGSIHERMCSLGHPGFVDSSRYIYEKIVEKSSLLKTMYV